MDFYYNAIVLQNALEKTQNIKRERVAFQCIEQESKWKHKII